MNIICCWISQSWSKAGSRKSYLEDSCLHFSKLSWIICWEVVAKVSFLCILEIRRLKRGKPKLKKKNIHVKCFLPIKSQELDSEDNQFCGFRGLCGGRSPGHVIMNFLMPWSQNTDALDDAVHGIGQLQHKHIHDQITSTVHTVTCPGRIQVHA